jgi:hypothetical protein
MYMLRVVIAATNVPQCIVPSASLNNGSNLQFQNLFPQNNGTNDMWFGDTSVAVLNGLKMPPGGGFGDPIFSYGKTYINQFYLSGTVGDVCNIMVFP